MLAFDTWIKRHHPEFLVEYKKIPNAKKTQTFYEWVKEKHPCVLLNEWPAVARIRARHLLHEVEGE
jgi:hypothetical protein